MEWFQASQWRDHCSSHIQSWKAQHCEVIVYRNTVIRPGYCPFCLWDKSLDAEDRLRQWLKSGNLKQHIEEKHMPGAKPICGCGQAFVNERGLRHHLHDTHKLNKSIWLNPKLPRKRKRTSKSDAQVLSTELEEQPTKKLRFYRYPPPRHGHGYRLSETPFLPTPTLGAFIEERPELLYYSDFGDKLKEGSRSGSVVSCFSEKCSPSSSQPATPDSAEVIDPRILEPLPYSIRQIAQPRCQMFMEGYSLEYSFDEQDGEQDIEKTPPRVTFAAPDIRLEEHSQSDGHVAKQVASLKRSSSEAELKPISFNDTKRFGHTPSSIATGEEMNNMNVLQEVCSRSMSDNGRYSVTERECGELPTSHQKTSDENIPHAEGLTIELRGRHTRVPLKEGPASHRPSNLTKEISGKKLSAKDKRMLRELKSQNLTLRQIGINFPDVDAALLRQTWTDMGASRRCTRSRAKQRGG
jgi:hypothetical protein